MPGVVVIRFTYQKYLSILLSGQRHNAPMYDEYKAAAQSLQWYEEDMWVESERKQRLDTFIAVNAPQALIDGAKLQMKRSELAKEISGGNYRRTRQRECN